MQRRILIVWLGFRIALLRSLAWLIMRPWLGVPVLLVYLVVAPLPPRRQP